MILKHIYLLPTFEYWKNGEIKQRHYTKYTKWIPTIVYTFILIISFISCTKCGPFHVKSVEYFNKMLTIFITLITYYIIQIWSGSQFSNHLKFYNEILKVDEELKTIGITLSTHNKFTSIFNEVLCLIVSSSYIAIVLLFDTRFNSNPGTAVILSYMNVSNVVASCDYILTIKLLGDRFKVLKNKNSLKLREHFKILRHLCELIETLNHLFSIKILAIFARDFCVLVRQLYVAAKYFSRGPWTLKYNFVIITYTILHIIQFYAKIWICHSTKETVCVLVETQNTYTDSSS